MSVQTQGPYPQIPENLGCCDKKSNEFRLPQTVNTEPRQAKDVWLGALFYLCLFAQFVLGIAIWSTRLTPTGLQESYNACTGVDSSRFALDSIGMYIAKYADVFSACIILVVVISIGWIFFLKSCTAVCVYTTIGLRVAIGIALAILFFKLGSVDTAVMSIVATVLYIAYMVWKRQEVLNAIEIFKLAATALIDRPAIVFSSVCMATFVFGYLFFLFFLIADTFNVGKYVLSTVYDTTGAPTGLSVCLFVNDSWAGSVRYFVSITWVWCMSTLQLSNMFIVSRNVSLWYFGQAASGIESVKLAFGKSIGTIAGGAIILTIVEEIENNATCPTCNCFLFCLWQVLKNYVQALSRYGVAIASISGAGFGPSVSFTFGMIRRHFHQGLVTNRIAVDMTSGFAWIFSLLVGLLGWVWVDESEELDPFAQGVLGGEYDGVLLWVFVILGIVWVLILYYYRMLGLFVCAMAPDLVTWVFGIGFTMGLFIALVSSYLFDLICYTVLYAVDAVLTCYCIDKDAPSGQSQHYQAIQTVAVLVPGYVAAPVAGQPGQSVTMAVAQPQPIMMTPVQQQVVMMQPQQGQPMMQPQYAPQQGQPMMQPQYAPQQGAPMQPQYVHQQPQYAAPPQGTAV